MRRVFTISAVPPSVNAQKAAVAVGGKPRLIKTKPYRQWIDATLIEVEPQLGFEGDLGENPFIWSSDILFPCNVSKMDVDNVPKAIHDLLVTAGKVPDDRYLADSRIRWSSGDKIIVTISKEDLSKWATVKKLSGPLMKKLAKTEGLPEE
jgi:Holliday junction resolvase RusA-like endonuclease